MSTEEAAADAMTGDPATKAGSRWNLKTVLLVLVVFVILVDVLAFALFPPFPAGGQPGESCAFPVCYINGTLEFPPPHVVIDFAPADPLPTGGLVIGFHPSITSTLLTMWLVAIGLLVAIIALCRHELGVPGRGQNFAEWAWESIAGFGTGLGGPTSRRYIPIFVSFFLLILFCNWSGLVPIIGKVDFLRAPTSDVNITIGLALVAFAIFEYEGFHRLGVGGYLSKFFPFYEFKNGVSAGAIALFVGLVELMLEFVKPLTLSMRLFGNIYGGEVALGVMTSLTLVALPVALLALEFMLNFIQALIFSVLTLMFIVLAIESHDHEEGEMAHEAVESLEGRQPAVAPAAAH